VDPPLNSGNPLRFGCKNVVGHWGLDTGVVGIVVVRGSSPAPAADVCPVQPAPRSKMAPTATRITLVGARDRDVSITPNCRTLQA
jgi:hypothetical protein